MYPDQIINEITQYCNKHTIKIDGIKIEFGKEHSWHPSISVNIKEPYISFCIKGLPSGCGLVLMHSFYTSIFTETTSNIVNIIFNAYYKDGAGSIICTLGNSKQGNPEQWGFVKISTYDNIRHSGPRHTQSLYIRSLNFK